MFSFGWRNNYGGRNNSWKKFALFAGATEAILLSSTIPVKDEKQRQELHESMVLNIKKAILKLRDQEFNNAEDLLHVALGIAQQIKDEQAEIFILDLLANMYFETRDYVKAEKAFKEVLSRELSSGRPEDTESVIEISAKLAKMYAEKGDTEKAKSGFDFCIEKFEKVFAELTENNKEEVMDLYFKVVQWGSELLVDMESKSEESLKEATKLIEKALQKAKELKQTGSMSYQTLANNLSTLYAWQNRVEEAVEMMTDTIKLAMSSGHWSLGSFHLNLAHIYAEHGDFANAEIQMKKAEDWAKSRKDEILAKEIERLKEDLRHRK